MDREQEIIELLKAVGEQLQQLDERMSNVEYTLNGISGALEMNNNVQKITNSRLNNIEKLVKLLPDMAKMVNDLHDKDISKTGVFEAQAR